jgi:hypothetical protein
MERFSLKKLNKVRGKEHWKIWTQRWKLIVPSEMIRENIKISAKESLGYFEF